VTSCKAMACDGWGYQLYMHKICMSFVGSILFAADDQAHGLSLTRLDNKLSYCKNHFVNFFGMLNVVHLH